MMTTPSSPLYSPSASSSAVTIPTPGKSILKRPPQQQQGFFNLARFSKYLPSQQAGSASNPGEGETDERRALKRAHFILPQMTTVYPISSSNPPSMPGLRDEKAAVEQKEAERRRRIVRANSMSAADVVGEESYWSMDKVESFYRECCEGREEFPHPPISAALKKAADANPRAVDFSGIQITVASAAILSDVLAIEWGLRKVVFKECDLDEAILKPLLHALLIPDSLHFLSVSSNRRLKTPAFRLIGAYLGKTKSLQFLDISQNPLEKKAVEYIAGALTPAPNPGLESLKLDDCALKPAALEVLAHAVRTSSLKNISLRHNRIGATGTVALALMIRDYPDFIPSSNSPLAPPSPIPSANSSAAPSPQLGTASLPASPVTTSSAASLSNVAASLHSPATRLPPPRHGPILPPPQHPSTAVQTTYTPYVPRAKRLAAARAEAAAGAPLGVDGKPVPTISSSAQGGVTARHASPVTQSSPALNARSSSIEQGPSAALLDKVRALDALPRLGALRTLDLKGNDIRGGITYIAQVLKRNRTLKVLNLSENKLDVQGLVSIAEALKYNSCLETLDLSRNPCCGPSLDGIVCLRTAFTLNTALKQLFLANTGLTSAGAIALAEFLPESSSLLALGLTDNQLDIAGIMALSSGLKANHVMRVLDLSIPPGDEDLARVCRDIFNTCVRNTQEAEQLHHAETGDSKTGPDRKAVWGMIEKSQLAKRIRQDEAKKNAQDVPSQAHACIAEMEGVLSAAPRGEEPRPLEDTNPDLAKKATGLNHALAALIQKASDPTRLEELLVLNDTLTDLLAGRYTPKPKPIGLGLAISNTNGHRSTNGSQYLEPPSDSDTGEEDEPTTPRVDKGKARAEPEPEVHEKVLSPTIALESEDEEERARLAELGIPPEEDEDAPTALDQSRSWVAEEGEVFRKGQILLTEEEMEGDYAGEELRVELLEAEVERPPPRTVLDDFGTMEVDPLMEPPPTPTPTVQEPTRPPPRPYIPRRRSSQASLNSVSSTGSATSKEGSIKSPTTPTPPSLLARPLLALKTSVSPQTSAPSSPHTGS